jgi:hypothetical protein
MAAGNPSLSALLRFRVGSTSGWPTSEACPMPFEMLWKRMPLLLGVNIDHVAQIPKDYHFVLKKTIRRNYATDRASTEYILVKLERRSGQKSQT